MAMSWPIRPRGNGVNCRRQRRWWNSKKDRSVTMRNKRNASQWFQTFSISWNNRKDCAIPQHQLTLKEFTYRTWMWKDWIRKWKHCIFHQFRPSITSTMTTMRAEMVLHCRTVRVQLKVQRAVIQTTKKENPLKSELHRLTLTMKCYQTQFNVMNFSRSRNRIALSMCGGLEFGGPTDKEFTEHIIDYSEVNILSIDCVLVSLSHDYFCMNFFSKTLWIVYLSLSHCLHLFHYFVLFSPLFILGVSKSQNIFLIFTRSSY